MTKSRSAPASKGAAAPQVSLPLVEKQEAAPPPQLTVGVFTPNILQLPTHEQLVGLLFILGLQTAPIAGHDRQGNLVNLSGNVVIPAALTPFFKLVAVAPEKPTA